MNTEKFILHEDRNVSLTAYIQDKSDEMKSVLIRPAVVVLPGGGYSFCSDREADPVAISYLNAGFHAFVLRYTLDKAGKWPMPLNDYDEAIELIYEHAEQWGVDTSRIAVVGFSAGGHLAACAATMAKHRPAAAILGYAATKRYILDLCAEGLPSPIEYVDEQTCPCFVFCTRNDNMVAISNSIDFLNALNKQNIMYEAHFYSYGTHGFMTGAEYTNSPTNTPRTKDWNADSIEWLGEVWGKITEKGITPPLFKRTVNDDNEEFLSVNCTYGHIKENSSAAELLADFIEKMKPLSHIKLAPLFNDWLLADLLRSSYTEEEIKSIDAKLNKIKNR